MKQNILKEKSFNFALRIVNLYKYLVEKKSEYVLSKQILRCGTSIGANVEEAIGGQSKKDFINKISIAYKEARETDYWLRILEGSGYIDKKMFNSLGNDCEEFMKIMGTIKKTILAQKEKK